MGNPWLKRGILVMDRAVTTTGASYVTAGLRFNDYLANEWMERTGSTAFTGAFCHYLVFDYGYVTAKPLSFDDPVKLIEMSNGRRQSQATRYPREGIQISYQAATIEEAADAKRFYLLCRGADQIIEFIDENDVELVGRLMSHSENKNPGNDAARPYTITFGFSLEHATEENILRSGSQGSI